MGNLIVGGVYDIDHSRKGKFRGRIISIDGDQCNVEIESGTARYVSHFNEDAESGDRIRIRTSLAKFTVVPR